MVEIVVLQLSSQAHMVIGVVSKGINSLKTALLKIIES